MTTPAAETLNAGGVRPISIVYVSDSTTVSGAEHVMLHYLERFRAPAFRTHVYFRASNERMRRALARIGIGYTATERFTTRIIQTTAHPGDLLDFARAFRGVRQELSAVIAREQADLLHAISYPASLYAAFASRATGTPIVWHEHNIKRMHRFNRPIYRWVAARCPRVIGPSDAVTQALARAGIGSPPLETLYNGIDLARFTPADDVRPRVRRELGLDDDQQAVCIVGQLLPYKGHRTLIEAAPAILASHPRTRFFIVGALENPPYESELRTAIQTAGLKDYFVFTGWRSDVHDVVAAMDVSVVATLTPEPAALSLMEAMALGCPLIATRTGGTPELVVDGETGLLFAPGDSASLARLVTDVCANSSLRRRLAEAGRRRMVERFSLERHLDLMAALYQSSVSRALDA